MSKWFTRFVDFRVGFQLFSEGSARVLDGFRGVLVQGTSTNLDCVLKATGGSEIDT